MSKPSVLFVCVHNAGRSQMAAAYLHHLSNGRIEVRSAGSAPGAAVNPIAVEAMAEDGIDISLNQPRVLTDQAVQASDVVITMGCGDACPIYPGKRYEDWELQDPAGQGIDTVRPIRDAIRRRVETLITELLPAANDPRGTLSTEPPTVLFVCVKNGGKSQMAAALARQHFGDAMHVLSAGTSPGQHLNAESVAALDEVGATTEGEAPKEVDPQAVADADLVVIIGPEAQLDTGSTPLQRWITDEPSTRGIDGMERMRLVRDDIAARVRSLSADLGLSS